MLLARPSDDQLQARLEQIDALAGDGFPTVSGQVCNQSSGLDADQITLNFVFYDRDGSPKLDHGTYQLDQVDAGECKRFSTTLTALQPWRKIGIGDVDWTWQH